MAVLSFAVFIASPAKPPTNVLLSPEVIALPVSNPIAVFLSPVVTSEPAW